MIMLSKEPLKIDFSSGFPIGLRVARSKNSSHQWINGSFENGGTESWDLKDFSAVPLSASYGP